MLRSNSKHSGGIHAVKLKPENDLAIDVPVAWKSVNMSRTHGFVALNSWGYKKIALHRSPERPHGFDVAFAILLCQIAYRPQTVTHPSTNTPDVG